MEDQLYSLLFVKKKNKVLLGLKLRGFGKDKWNGYGGKIEPNETIYEGAIRELKEESDLVIQKEDLTYHGYILYKHINNNNRLVYIFVVQNFQGNPMKTEEMQPCWFGIHDLPFQNMWPDCQFWVPEILDGRYIQSEFVYNDKCEIVSKVIHKFTKEPNKKSVLFQ